MFAVVVCVYLLVVWFFVCAHTENKTTQLGSGPKGV